MATLDTNVKGDTAAETILTTEKCVTVYVVEKTGTHDNHHVGLEASPNGSDWVPISETIRGVGARSYSVCATRVRAAVLEAEGSTSTVDVFIVAR